MEVWKIIEGYENYKISNLQKIKNKRKTAGGFIWKFKNT